MKSNLFLCFRCGRRFDENHIGHVDDHMEICDICHGETQPLTEKCVEKNKDHAIINQ